MEWELIQGVVIDGVRIHTGSCYRWSKDSCRDLLKMEWELILKYVYEILKTCSVILLSKKVFAPWFHGLQKKCLPRDFQKENNSAPRDFFDHKKSPPRDLRCAKKYPPRCILTGPVSDKFCQLPRVKAVTFNFEVSDTASSPQWRSAAWVSRQNPFKRLFRKKKVLFFTFGPFSEK